MHDTSSCIHTAYISSSGVRRCESESEQQLSSSLLNQEALSLRFSLQKSIHPLPKTKNGPERPRAKDHIGYQTIRSDSDIPPPLSCHSIVTTEDFKFNFSSLLFPPPANSDGTPFLGLPSDFPRPGWMRPTTDPKRRRENPAGVGGRGGPARSREQPCLLP